MERGARTVSARRWLAERQGLPLALLRAGGGAPLVFLLSMVLSYSLLQGRRVGADAAPEALPPPARAEESLPVPPARGLPEPPAAEAAGSVRPVSGPTLLPSVAAGPEALEAEPDSSALRVTTGRIPDGGTLARALGEQGVSSAVVHSLGRALRGMFSFRRAQPGDFYALIQNEARDVLAFEYQRGRRTVYRLERTPLGELRASRSELPLERRVVQLGGVVERSLFDAIIGLGEGSDLVQRFADVFIWEIDFSTQTRAGDEFRLVFEKFYDRAGFVSYGHVLAARYRSGERDLTALYYEDEEGYGDYYTPDGNSVRRTFLRAPVKYTRISSRYSRSRLHPILKVRRPHEGVDYAAPKGTPIWAVADGKVIFRGWSGGFGRLIKIRHDNGYVSYYGHLSRYAKGLGVGDRVAQKQVIGYVGSSGLSTAPHVCYRLRVNGRFVDPLSVRFPRGEPVPVRGLERFERVRDTRLAELGSATPPLVLEAGM